MMGFGALFTVVFLGAIAYALGWFPQRSQSAPENTNTTESALDILKARYARGEITKAEYEEMRNDLTD